LHIFFQSALLSSDFLIAMLPVVSVDC